MPDLLILHWSRETLRGLSGAASDGGIVIRSLFDVTWPDSGARNDEAIRPDPVESGAWLRAELERLGISTDSVSVILSRDDVVMRRLRLPEAADEALPELIKYQTAARSAVPADQLAIDFVASPPDASGTRHALVVATPRRLVQDIETSIQAAGMQLESIGVDAVVLGELVSFAEAIEVGQAGDALGLVFAANHLDVSLFRGGVLASSYRAVGVRPDDHQAVRAAVQRLLLAEADSVENAAPERAWLVGADELPATAIESLAKALGADVRRLDLELLDSLRFPAGRTPADWATSASLMGAALERTARQRDTIDLLHPRQTPQRPDRRKLYVAAAAIAVVAMLAAVLLGTRLYLQSLEDRLVQLDRENRELQAELENGQSDVELDGLLDDWEARRVDWLAELDGMIGEMPGTERLYLDEIRWTPGSGEIVATLQTTGWARARMDVEQLNQQLDELPTLRIRPNEINSPNRQAEYPVRFEIDADLLLKRANR